MKTNKRIANKLTAIKLRLPFLKEYFYSSYFQQILKQLPENWFNTELVLNSIDERIANIESALKDNKIRYLADVSLLASPGYRVAVGLVIASTLLSTIPSKDPLKKPQNELSSDSLSVARKIGLHTINDDFKVFNYNGFSARPIVDLCLQSSKSFLDIAENIGTMVNAHLKNPPSNKDQIINANLELLAELNSDTDPDWKDMTPPPHH